MRVFAQICARKRAFLCEFIEISGQWSEKQAPASAFTSGIASFPEEHEQAGYFDAAFHPQESFLQAGEDEA